jgi:hypothetical protein
MPQLAQGPRQFAIFTPALRAFLDDFQERRWNSYHVSLSALCLSLQKRARHRRSQSHAIPPPPTAGAEIHSTIDSTVGISRGSHASHRSRSFRVGLFRKILKVVLESARQLARPLTPGPSPARGEG